jgi:hypothetical protein
MQSAINFMNCPSSKCKTHFRESIKSLQRLSRSAFLYNRTFLGLWTWKAEWTVSSVSLRLASRPKLGTVPMRSRQTASTTLSNSFLSLRERLKKRKQLWKRVASHNERKRLVHGPFEEPKPGFVSFRLSGPDAFALFLASFSVGHVRLKVSALGSAHLL